MILRYRFVNALTLTVRYSIQKAPTPRFSKICPDDCFSGLSQEDWNVKKFVKICLNIDV